MANALTPFTTWCDRLTAMDDSARMAAVDGAPYPVMAMILHFLRRSRSELFNTPTQALRWLDLAQRLMERGADPRGDHLQLNHRWIEARLAHARAACFMIQGRLQSAHELYLSALRGFEALEDAVFAATVKRGLLFTLTQMGRQAEAVALGLEALAVFRRWHLKHDYLSTMNNLGLVELSRGRLDRAEAIFRRLRRAASPERHYFPYIFHNLVLVRMERGNLMEAMADIGEFIRLCRATENRIEEARGLFMLGECLLLLDRPEEAVQNLSEAKSMLTEARAAFDMALIQIYLAKALTLIGRPQDALPLIAASAEYLRREGYVTVLSKLLDTWVEALSDPDRKLDRSAEEAFTFARYYRHCIPPPPGTLQHEGGRAANL